MHNTDIILNGRCGTKQQQYRSKHVLQKKEQKQEGHPVYSKEGMKPVSLSSYFLYFAFYRLPYDKIVDI
jgi:hypothetical protein